MPDRLKRLEEAWLKQTTPEDVYFACFEDPKPLRRSNTVPDAFADLEFGHYKDMDGKIVESDRAIWLGMILGMRPGAGGALLKLITSTAARCGVSVIGAPTSLQPQAWTKGRALRKDAELLAWYARHDFRIVQSRFETRVVYLGTGSDLSTQFALK